MRKSTEQFFASIKISNADHWNYNFAELGEAVK